MLVALLPGGQQRVDPRADRRRLVARLRGIVLARDRRRERGRTKAVALREREDLRPGRRGQLRDGVQGGIDQRIAGGEREVGHRDLPHFAARSGALADAFASYDGWFRAAWVCVPDCAGVLRGPCKPKTATGVRHYIWRV